MRSSTVGLLIVVGIGVGCRGKSKPDADDDVQGRTGSGGMSAQHSGSGGSAVVMTSGGGNGAPSVSGSGGQSSIGTNDAGTGDAGPIVDAGPSDGGMRTTAATGPLDLPTHCSFTLSGNATITVGDRVRTDIYMDPNAKKTPAPGGPMIFYWHASGTNSLEVVSAFGQDNIDKVVAMGGVVAAFESAPPPDAGSGTGVGVWFVEDFDVADEVLACAIRDANIDRKHIHALGMRAGALQTVVMQLVRANYMASVISYTGGLNPSIDTTNDATNLSSALLTFAPTAEAVIDFPALSQQYHDEQSPKGRFVMLCNHSDSQGIDTNIAPLALRFFMDNGYKVVSPYKGGHIPTEFPSYCME